MYILYRLWSDKKKKKKVRDIINNKRGTIANLAKVKCNKIQ